MTVQFRTPTLDASVIFKLREMTPAFLDEAEDKLYRASQPVTVIEHQEVGLYDYYVVHSGDRVHEVVRLGFFVKCDCEDFHYSLSACKHVPLCMPQVCRKCLGRPVEQRGKLCLSCDSQDITYLPPTSNYKPQTLGGVRF